jgi:large repetitive protein
VRTFAVTVLAANDAPSFVKGPGQDTHDEAGAVQVAGWATAISAGAPNESGQQLSFTVTADMPNLFSVPPAIDASGTLTYTPALNASGDAVVTVVLRDNGGIENGGVDASAAQTFAIHVVKLRPMHNAAKPLDASGDNAISAADPLACINHLNAFGSGPVSEAPEGMGFLDVNADGFVSSADPLAVINHINAFGTESDAPEGEAAIGSALAQIEWAAGSSAATSDDLSGVIAMLALDSGRAATRRRGRA